jgi:hypothetical protein
MQYLPLYLYRYTNAIDMNAKKIFFASLMQLKFKKQTVTKPFPNIYMYPSVRKTYQKLLFNIEKILRIKVLVKKEKNRY